jgi:hypothetical protein
MPALSVPRRRVLEVALLRGEASGDVLDARTLAVEHPLEEVAKTCVRKRALGLGRSRGEDAASFLPGMSDGRAPERRLADARLALQQQRSRSVVRRVDERAGGRELVLSTEDLERHRP